MPKKNGFAVFMYETKRAYERNYGRPFSMAEMQEICGRLWPDMTRAQKLKYKATADGNEPELPPPGKTPFELQQEQTENTKQSVIDKIRQGVQSASQQGQLTNMKFYFIHFNVLCETNDKVFVPCEVALVEYCLEDGITQFVHSFMKAPEGMIPLGYAYTIQLNAEKIHALDRNSEELKAEAASDWDFILTKMLDLVRPDQDGAVPPLYTLEEDVPQVTSILSEMLGRSKVPERRGMHLDVYPVNHLLVELDKKARETEGRSPKSPLVVNQFFGQIVASIRFKFTTGVSCPFHEWADKTHNCSLTLAKRLAFIISWFIVPILEIPYIVGRHCTKEEPFQEHVVQSDRVPEPLPDGFLCPWSGPKAEAKDEANPRESDPADRSDVSADDSVQVGDDHVRAHHYDLAFPSLGPSASMPAAAPWGRGRQPSTRGHLHSGHTNGRGLPGVQGQPNGLHQPNFRGQHNGPRHPNFYGLPSSPGQRNGLGQDDDPRHPVRGFSGFRGQANVVGQHNGLSHPNVYGLLGFPGQRNGLGLRNGLGQDDDFHQPNDHGQPTGRGAHSGRGQPNGFQRSRVATKHP